MLLILRIWNSYFKRCKWSKQKSKYPWKHINNHEGRSVVYLSFGLFSQALHAFKYRDRTTIVSDVLKTVKDSRRGMRKTQIMQSANLNYIQTKKYLNYMLNYGFLVVTERDIYLITEKGARYLQLIEMYRTHNIR
jgi:predicted transcriptional regulator